mgnify:CR=1 FL=1
MITNFDVNKVYIAEGLSSLLYSDASKCLVTLFEELSIEWEHLPFTNSPLHIWARDYMPVQVSSGKFVKFRYDPDYLKDYPEYKPDMDSVLNSLGIELFQSPINLDGGNVISCGDKVILTDKIFKENLEYSCAKLLDQLTVLLEAEPVIIPWDKYEIYGHADGMVRYIGAGRVLLNNYCDFDKALRKKLLAALSPHFDVEELHYGCYSDNSWAYCNFLNVGNHIFVPMLNEKTDSMALTQIEAAFPHCKCHQVSGCEKIVKDGGALNCSTWSVLNDFQEKEELEESLKE